MLYEHTQVGRLFQVMLAAVALAAAVGAVTRPHPAPATVVPILVVGLALISVFTRLTTRVGEGRLEYEFGLGFWRTRVPIDQIVSVGRVRNAWWYGFGIRLTPHGWLYNVWGFDAVEVRLANGRTFRLGTDEPDRLATAIREAGGRPRSSR
jgi:hypothetical protein